jgi:integrase
MGAIAREKIKGSGEYYVFINFQGKRRAKFIGNVDKAEKAAKYINAKIELGIYDMKPAGQPKPSEILSVKEYALITIEERYPEKTHIATNSRYKSVVKKDFRGKFGDTPIDEVEPIQIWKLLQGLSFENRTPRSMALTRTVLSLCFSMAVMEKIIPENPMNDLPKKKKSSNSSIDIDKPYEINPFTEDQMIKFIDTAMEYSPTMYGPMFLCGFRTGMRLGEILSMQWSHIDWDRGVISVYQSFGRFGLGQTKTRKTREVDMSIQLHEVLAELLLIRKHEAEKSGKKTHESIIFHSKGGYRSQNATRKAFKKVLALADLPKKRVHDMRHSFASILLSKGASIYYIKDQLGHKKISMTSDMYGRFIPGTNRTMVSILDHPLNSKPTSES